MTQATIYEILKKKGVVIKNMTGSLAELHKYIMDDETICSALDGADGLIVLTNRRVLILYKGFLTGLEMEEYQLKDVSSVEVDPGFLTTTIKITAGFNNKVVTTISKEATLKFKIDISAAQKDLSNTPASSPQPDMMAQLEKLAELKSKGILTEEEFTQEKKKLLNK